MSKGEFNNLKGCGKPLQSHQSRNPYVDFVTHKINEVSTVQVFCRIIKLLVEIMLLKTAHLFCAKANTILLSIKQINQNSLSSSTHFLKYLSCSYSQNQKKTAVFFSQQKILSIGEG